MKQFCVSLILLVTFCSAFAQKEIIATATDFITHNEYGKANRYLDSVLKKHPKTVDALMMKGNVLLNYSFENGSNRYFNTDAAESIFDTSAISQEFFVPIVTLDTSKLIEQYWKRCLLIDSTRNDIKKGLCNLYSLSLRTGELRQALEKIRPLITASEDNAFIYAQYARNIKARGEFDTAMTIYQQIADMFPQLAGIRCDMAGEYFYNGRPNDALRYLDSTLSKKDIDQTSFINAATIYSMLGYYDQALKTFTRYSEQDTLYVADFYKGLMLFANMDSGFYEQLQGFLKHASEQSYYDEITLAQKLIPFGRVGFTIEDYLPLAQNPKIPPYYKVLIHQRAMRQFKDDCLPSLLYGYFQSTCKNYSMARQFLDDAAACKIPEGYRELLQLTAAYNMYQSGEIQASKKLFEPLLKSTDIFKQQAAKYFTFQLLASLKLRDANKLLKELVFEQQKTKYQWLALNR